MRLRLVRPKKATSGFPKYFTDTRILPVLFVSPFSV